MIEEEHETNGTAETSENGITEIKTNGIVNEVNIGAITSKIHDILGLLDSFKSHHSSPSPEEKIELLKLSNSIGSKILEL